MLLHAGTISREAIRSGLQVPKALQQQKRQGTLECSKQMQSQCMFSKTLSVTDQCMCIDNVMDMDRLSANIGMRLFSLISGFADALHEPYHAAAVQIIDVICLWGTRVFNHPDGTKQSLQEFSSACRFELVWIIILPRSMQASTLAAKQTTK